MASTLSKHDAVAGLLKEYGSAEGFLEYLETPQGSDRLNAVAERLAAGDLAVVLEGDEAVSTFNAFALDALMELDLYQRINRLEERVYADTVDE